MQKFEKTLVVRLFGRRLPFHFLNSELMKRWNRFGRFRLVSVNAKCLICFFDDMAARDSILMGGPWVVAGQVLGLDRWTPKFSLLSGEGLITPIWVRLPGLPFYCWDANNIARITSYIGEPLWIDAATDRLERGSFARACVQLDLAKPLKAGVWVQGFQGQFFQPFEYEGISSLCFKCGCVGHKAQLCGASVDNSLGPLGAAKEKEIPSQVDGVSVGKEPHSSAGLSITERGDEAEERGVGPWVLVARKKRHTKGGKGLALGTATSTVRKQPTKASDQVKAMVKALGAASGAALVTPFMEAGDPRVYMPRASVPLPVGVDLNHIDRTPRPATLEGSLAGRELFAHDGGGDASSFRPP